MSATQSWRRLPAGVWAMGVGSLFMDTSSELIHGVLPLFMVTVLGASMVTVGMVEGLAEATAAIVKVFSGVLSDRLGKRKALLVAGYGLSALTKPMFPLATTMTWVFLSRFVDRVGKGVRGAPRDALIADITPPAQRGAAYGLRQALDSVGAVLGPLLAVVLMIQCDGDSRTVMWFGVVPAVAAVMVFAIALDEPSHVLPRRAVAKDSLLVEMKRLPRRYWAVVALGALFTLARFSEAFLVLRARDVGLALDRAPFVMVVMNAFFAASALPGGIAADRVGPRTLFSCGLILLVAADVVLAAATSPLAALAGTALWGMHMGMTQGLLSKMVADTVPSDAVATGFGLFNLVSGIALFGASALAGILWATLGPAATFMAGAAIASLGAVGLLLSLPRWARA